MTAETINKNINRLYQFYNVDEGRRDSFDGWHEPKFILQTYGRILDWNGAPRSGLSTLYLPPEEYHEMEGWLASVPVQMIYQYEDNPHIGHTNRPASLGFLWDGYQWHIQKVSS